MKTLQLTLYPNPLLRKKAESINTEFIASLSPIIDDMIHTMKKEDGVGLAAPQIGKSIRLFVVAYKDSALTLINPTFKKMSFRKDSAEEGCLSIPGVSGIVKRHKRLLFEALDRNGKKFSGEAEGLFARILQHEMDHINGILFIDRASKILHDKANN